MISIPYRNLLFYFIGNWLCIYASSHSTTSEDEARRTTTNAIPHVQADFLSWQPRIIYYENFLSSDECDFIISYAKNNSRYKVPEIDDSVSIYFPTYPNLPPLLKEIERRIGVATGSPPHPGT